MNKDAVFEQLLRLRLLVAAIGERASTPWWRTEFLSTTGLRVGQRIFPQSFRRAGLTSASVAACRDHDANTGRRSFHLFRFPAHIERQLNHIAILSNEWSIPDSFESLVADLVTLQSSTCVPAASGPKSLGSIDVLSKPTTPSILASYYCDALRNEKRIYPYFEAVGDE